MGLCKCPKRRVTNQFCFEHRVNVCEHCMVTNHPKCIVQSYIQWLQDSDYNAICQLCTQQLGNQECIRLTCYHVFHWSCLELMFRKLPRTTAPAGYQCPNCHSALFPPSNLVSPVADVLREKLAGVNWARAGLGLSLLCEEADSKSNIIQHSGLINSNDSDNQFGPNGYTHNSSYSTHSNAMGSSIPHRVTPIGASDDESGTRKVNGPPYSVVQVPEDSYDSSAFDNYGTPRKVYESVGSTRHSSSSRFDHDDDKYKRKSATEWLIRWWKNTLPPARKRTTGHFNRRSIATIVFIGAVVLFILFILMKIGRASTENDSSLNYHNNPHIRVEQP